ncbi:MAG TPA: EVE domain-containing protein [Candidatus Paceibacterota bacterium]|nr:EVE domain-containing protein [Candidatus Paceibacterota bacterium]HMO83164.1 EVE domain-containing protein [Candidatus Paceibacterota bacterium]
MKYWIMKSEPDTFSIDDLEKTKTQFWDGVRNYRVRNMFRDEMKVGDRAFFYHSSCKEIGIAGEMEVIKSAEIDPTQFDPKSDYYDPGAKKDTPRWMGPTVKFVKKFKRILTLGEIKRNPSLQKLAINEKGNRLSVTEITKPEYLKLKKLI